MGQLRHRTSDLPELLSSPEERPTLFGSGEHLKEKQQVFLKVTRIPDFKFTCTEVNK